jgi:hypothetical protein
MAIFGYFCSFLGLYELIRAQKVYCRFTDVVPKDQRPAYLVVPWRGGRSLERRASDCPGLQGPVTGITGRTGTQLMTEVVVMIHAIVWKGRIFMEGV